MFLNAKGGMGRIDAESETFVTHSLRADGFDASEDGTGRGTPTGPLDTDGHTMAIAFTERTRADGRNFECQEEVAYALDNPGAGGRTQTRNVAYNMAVRRLTPRECERLQGFPDDWTLIPYGRHSKRCLAQADDASCICGFKPKPAADGPRYRAIGNSMAVPVMRWLGERIQMVDVIRRGRHSTGR